MPCEKYFVRDGRSVVKRMWSGIIAFTSDGFPLVGRSTESMSGRTVNGEWFAGCYCEHGMDKSWLTGEALVDMIIRKDVSSWLPSLYFLSEERLNNMKLDDALLKF